MGLLNAAQFGSYGPGAMKPPSFAPQMPPPPGPRVGDPGQTPPFVPQAPMGGGLAGAFSGNPQFQQQLQAMLAQQSPGFQGAQMMPPQAPVSMNQQGQGGMGGGMAPGGAMGANGLGSNIGAMERWRAMQGMNVR